MLEKKEFAWNYQINEQNQMIVEQKEQIDNLTKHVQKLEQVALINAKAKQLSMCNDEMSFDDVSRGDQSFIRGTSSIILDSPQKLHRINSTDTLDLKKRSKADSASKISILDNEFQGINISDSSQSDVIATYLLKDDNVSKHGGSLIEQHSNNSFIVDDDENQRTRVSADDGYRSQNSDDIEEVKVELIQEQIKIESQIKKTQAKAPIVIQRRDPEEEFFMLAVLALKMQHTEHQEADFIHMVDSAKLFEQVKQLKLPFFKWYCWLDTEFSLMKIAFAEGNGYRYIDLVKYPDALVNTLAQAEE